MRPEGPGEADAGFFLYEPPFPGGIWIDDGTRVFPPTDGRITQLTYNQSNRIEIELLPNNPRVMQVLVSSPGARPPVGQKVTVTELDSVDAGVGGLMIDLNPAGFRESFEWGIPAGWGTSGLWRSVNDRDVGDARCASALTGRRAAGFSTYETCTYDNQGSPSTGALTSPSFTIPDSPQAKLVFHHWSATERRRYVDVRRVWLRLSSSSVLLADYFTEHDFGSFDSWVRTQISLSAYAGQSAQLEFEFDSVDGFFDDYAGWYIDDIEVTE